MSLEVQAKDKSSKKKCVCCKVNVDERWSRKMNENFHLNKMFWKEIQKKRMGISGHQGSVKTEDARMTVIKKQFWRWAEYFQGLLNVEKDREA